MPFHLGYFAVGAVLFGRSLLACASMRRVPFLPGASALDGGQRVTVVVVTRDDRADLVETLDDLASQEGCLLDTVVVDDRSSDSRGVEVACAGRDGVRFVRVDEVASGWLPWSHALQSGAEAADQASDWLLLLEQPIRLLRADAIARGLAALRAERASVLWLVPRVRGGLLAPSVLTAIADALPAMAATNRDRESVPWPGTACLGRRESIAGALAGIRSAMAPVFDAVLFERLAAEGRRARYAFATDEIEAPRARMTNAVETLERLLATLGFRPTWMIVALVAYGAMWTFALLGAFTGSPWGLWAFGGLASLAIPCFLIARLQRTSVLASALAPFVFPFEAGITLWAIVRAWRRGGVRWRGMFVPLDQLREAADSDTE